MRTLELLAPAKNLEIGKAAIDHGADAVYIGAPRFGARAAVGNSVNDIRELCRYAHLFGVKVHVTVNTIVYDDELEDTLIMISDLADAGVDALLLQDMGVAERCLQMQVSGELPRIPVVAVGGLQSGCPCPRIVSRGNSRYPPGCPSCRVGGLCSWCTLCELLRSVLCLATLFQTQCQQGGMCPVLQIEIRFTRQQWEGDRASASPLVVERYVQDRPSGGFGGCRSLLFQD